MIPKSLLIALVTGVTAGAITGLYLQNLNSQNILFVEGSAISIHVENQDHKTGQNVLVRIINTGTTEIRFSDDLPSFRVRALDGTIFFSTSFGELTLAPKQQHVYEWNQQKNDGTKIIEGRYVAESFAYGRDNQKVSDSITLNILK